ncbi:hypothetical protein, partial [Arsenophonus sp.]
MHLAKSNRNYFKPFSRYKESGCMHLAKSNRNYFKPFSRYKEEYFTSYEYFRLVVFLYYNQLKNNFIEQLNEDHQ